MAARYIRQTALIGSFGISWLGMVSLHECGHVLHAWTSGGAVQQVVLRPTEISRTDVSPNPRPLWVAWGGAIWGCIIPLAMLISARRFVPKLRHSATFFAGFCCIANGAYISFGSLGSIGDAGDLLRHGARHWELWLFGLTACGVGLYLWHSLGPRLGLNTEVATTRNALTSTLVFAVIAMILWTVF